MVTTAALLMRRTSAAVVGGDIQSLITYTADIGGCARISDNHYSNNYTCYMKTPDPTFCMTKCNQEHDCDAFHYVAARYCCTFKRDDSSPFHAVLAHANDGLCFTKNYSSWVMKQNKINLNTNFDKF